MSNDGKCLAHISPAEIRDLIDANGRVSYGQGETAQHGLIVDLYEGRGEAAVVSPT